MKTAESVIAVRRVIGGWKRHGERVGFVPTMGYLHDGHLSLVRRAREENSRVVVSIFVNPTQFGVNEDLDRYPRDTEGDMEKLRAVGANLLFLPPAGEMYPQGFQTFVDVGSVAEPLCGTSRPGHFRGVATVVTKLLNVVEADSAYFGAKDYQQCAVIRRLVTDLNIDTDVVVCPTVREPDGLAMSSRNAYLSSEERAAATVLFRALTAARDLARSSKGTLPVSTLREILVDMIAKEPLARLEYAEIRDAETLEEIFSVSAEAVMALAVRIGTTRLIDNMVIPQRKGT